MMRRPARPARQHVLRGVKRAGAVEMQMGIEEPAQIGNALGKFLKVWRHYIRCMAGQCSFRGGRLPGA